MQVTTVLLHACIHAYTILWLATKLSHAGYRGVITCMHTFMHVLLWLEANDAIDNECGQ